MAGLTAWRHARPRLAEGCCIGRLDVGVDARKSKRLAHRIRAWARRESAPRSVVTSPLQRCRDVGVWLAAWGWTHRIDARLLELDFGTWQGQRWQAVGKVEIDAWCGDFAEARPGGGESVAALLARCAAFMADRGAGQLAEPASCVVTHAGWISAARWLQRSDGALLEASVWPAAPRHGERVEL